MKNAPDSVQWHFWQPEFDTLGLNATLERCHNLYIDEAGYAYLSGCNMNGGGVIIVDVFTDPENPNLVGVCDPRYSHDNFTRGDTVWSGDINNGVFSAIDVRDKANPVTLATQATSRNFAHNTWLSDDGKFLFTTDERPDANVDAYDVSDLNNIVRLDVFRPLINEPRGVIPHNTHYYQGFLVTSWYTDGVVITDVHKPDNMIQVGSYDTYPGADGGYNGAWGAYPFLPSGLLLVSDIQTGLYVLNADYKRASYLEGAVRNADNGNPITGATIQLAAFYYSDVESDLEGNYKTGTALEGDYEVTVYHPEYNESQATVSLRAGEVTIKDFELVPKKRYSLGGSVKETGFNNQFIPGAHVIAINDELRYETVTGPGGDFTLEVLEGTYDLLVAAWGYQQLAIEDVSFVGDERRLFELEIGYEDDYFADLGWTTENTASAGHWERDIPEATFLGPLIANPDSDVNGDIGEECYVTGNDGRGDAGRDDVDNGTTRLISPPMDLLNYQDPSLEFAYWFFVGSGRGAPNDTMHVWVTNGIGDTILLFKTGTITNRWALSDKYRLKDLIELSREVRILVDVSDDAAQGHVVEAGFDRFRVQDNIPSSTGTRKKDALISISPNPFSNEFTIQFDRSVWEGEISYEIMDPLGRRLRSGMIGTPDGRIVCSDLPSGQYWVRIWKADEMSKAFPVIKIH
jgi:hypothetical protein